MKKLLLYLSLFLIFFTGTGCEKLDEKEEKADQLRQESQALLAEHMKTQEHVTNESEQEQKKEESDQQSTSNETSTAVAVTTNTTAEPKQNVTESSETTTQAAENQENNRVSVTVTKVVDGDTIKVMYEGKEESVRMIGVDTPESVHPDKSRNTEEGKIASNYTKAQLEGKTVELEFDVQQRDKYGRLLAYVWLGNSMYNSHLLSQGIAQMATYPPNVKYVDTFTALQKEAREKKIGFWADAQPKQEKVAEKPKQQQQPKQQAQAQPQKTEQPKQQQNTETAKQPQAPPKSEYNTTPPAGVSYIGNSNTKKFHHASCGSVKKMKPAHIVKLNSREEAINAGYQPCGKCKP